MSSSPTASPAEVLILTTPQHRRARSAPWSYHFYPDEAWVDLKITLPFAILLKEVQIQPHSPALSSKLLQILLTKNFLWYQIFCHFHKILKSKIMAHSFLFKNTYFIFKILLYPPQTVFVGKVILLYPPPPANSVCVWGGNLIIPPANCLLGGCILFSCYPLVCL